MSIFKQQKRLWFLAGAGFTGLGVFTLECLRMSALRPQKEAWQGVATVSAQLPGAHAPTDTEEPVEPMFGQQLWYGAARKWNSGVDAVCQPIVKELARRGL